MSIEMSLDRINFVDLPHTIPIQVGPNKVYLRRKETELLDASEITEMIIYVIKNINTKVPTIDMIEVVKDGLRVTFEPTFEDGLEISADGVMYFDLPRTFTGVVGDNRFRLRYKESDEFMAGNDLFVDVNLQKSKNPNRPDINRVNYRVEDGTDIIMSGDTTYEVSIDGGETYHPLPVILDGEIGENEILVRIAENTQYGPSDPISMTVDVPKLVNHDTVASNAVTFITDGLLFTVVSAHDGIEVSYDGSDYAPIPQDYIGVPGENTVSIRFAETATMLPSEPTDVNVFLTKGINPKEVDLSKVVADVSNPPVIKLSSLDPELEIMGTDWVDFPLTVTKPALGTYQFKIRIKETDMYKASEYVLFDVELDRVPNNTKPTNNQISMGITIESYPVGSSVKSDIGVINDALEVSELGTLPWLDSITGMDTPPGRNVVFVRFKQTPYKLASEAVEFPFAVSKFPNPETPDIGEVGNVITISHAVVSNTIRSSISVSNNMYELSSDGVQWSTSLTNVLSQIGNNSIKVRLAETDTHSPGSPVDYHYSVSKFENPGQVLISHTVSGTNISFTSSDASNMEISIDGGVTYRNIPYTHSGVIGLNEFMVRRKETEIYLAGEPQAYNVNIGKQPQTAIPASSINISTNATARTISVSVASGIVAEARLTHGTQLYTSVPTTFNGRSGENIVWVRRPETDTHLASPFTAVTVTLPVDWDDVEPVVDESWTQSLGLRARYMECHGNWVYFAGPDGAGKIDTEFGDTITYTSLEATGINKTEPYVAVSIIGSGRSLHIYDDDTTDRLYTKPAHLDITGNLILPHAGRCMTFGNNMYFFNNATAIPLYGLRTNANELEPQFIRQNGHIIADRNHHNAFGYVQYRSVAGNVTRASVFGCVGDNYNSKIWNRTIMSYFPDGVGNTYSIQNLKLITNKGVEELFVTVTGNNILVINPANGSLKRILDDSSNFQNRIWSRDLRVTDRQGYYYTIHADSSVNRTYVTKYDIETRDRIWETDFPGTQNIALAIQERANEINLYVTINSLYMKIRQL